MISRRKDEVLAEIDCPQLQKIQPRLEKTDALITCAGFEDRALAFLVSAVGADSRGFDLIGIDYRPEVEENRIARFHELAAKSGARKKLVTYERQEPESATEILLAAENANRIFLDISGMSRLLIVQLVAAGVRMGLLERMAIIYTEAEVYPPTQKEVEEKLAADEDYLGILNFISSGVFGITIVPELSTVAMQGQPIRLVAFPSFNPTQFAAVCAEIQASFFTIVNGVPPSIENLWRRDVIRKLNNIDSIREREEFEVSTFDYRETYKLLLNLYAQRGAVEKIVVSPTGSKMQSVAVGLVCGFLRDIQVVYPTPRSFPSPSNYTTGAACTYQLLLGAFAAAAHSEVDEQAHVSPSN